MPPRSSRRWGPAAGLVAALVALAAVSPPTEANLISLHARATVSSAVAGYGHKPDECHEPAPRCCPGFIALSASDHPEAAAHALPPSSAAEEVCVDLMKLDLHDSTLPVEVRKAILLEAKEEKKRLRKRRRRGAAPPAPPMAPSPPPAPPPPPMPPPAPSTAPRDWWGNIRNSPTRDAFTTTEELNRKCRDRMAPVPLLDLPLSLDKQDFRRLFLTQEDWTGTAYGYWDSKRLLPVWASLRPYLPHRLSDVIDVDKPYPTCAVVGNSGNLLTSRFGSLIDAQSTVFRINKGPLTGFEQYVGNKTNFRLLNKRHFIVMAQNGLSHRHFEKLPEDHNVTYLVSRSPPKLMEHHIPRALARENRKPKGIKYVPATNRIFDYANKLLSSYMGCMSMRGVDMGSFKSSTSGLMGVLVAIHLCERVSVFGIGQEPLEPSTPYQYFYGSTEYHFRKTVNSHHSITAEGALIEALGHAGLVTYHKISLQQNVTSGDVNQDT